MPARVRLFAVLVAALAGCGQAPRRETVAPERRSAVLTVTSPAFKAGGTIPKRHSRKEGDNVSPPLSWTGAPEGTKGFAIVCDDPDAPGAKPWVHWVLYGIPAGSAGLAEGQTAGGVEGVNSWNAPGYDGPQPPAGHGPHHYHFRVYALDTEPGLGPGASKEKFLAAMKGHILAEGALVGVYERK